MCICESGVHNYNMWVSVNIDVQSGQCDWCNLTFESYLFPILYGALNCKSLKIVN